MLRTSDEVAPETDNLLVEVLLARVGLHVDFKISACARKATIARLPGRLVVYCGDITLQFPNCLLDELSLAGLEGGAAPRR